MYRLIASVLLVLALCGFRPVPPPLDGPVRVSVIDRDQDQQLPHYLHRGQQWVAGTPGNHYSVRLENRSGQRVLVVLSVDGVNAITGQTASPDQSGYVLEPWQSSEISGWRKSNEEVAQFVFTRHGDSYASRTGRPANVGVIGIAVFNEQRHSPKAARGPTVPPPHRHMARRKPNASGWAPAMASVSGRARH